MIPLLTSVVVVLEIAAMLGIYYLRTTKLSSLAQSEVVLLYAPPILAAVICAAVIYRAPRSAGRPRSIAMRMAVGILASGVGAFVAMLVAVNLWGV